MNIKVGVHQTREKERGLSFCQESLSWKELDFICINATKYAVKWGFRSLQQWGGFLDSCGKVAALTGDFQADIRSYLLGLGARMVVFAICATCTVLMDIDMLNVYVQFNLKLYLDGVWLSL